MLDSTNSAASEEAGFEQGDREVNIEPLVKLMQNLAESLRPFLSQFAAFADEMSRVDWSNVVKSFNAGVEARIAGVRQLAAKGWTVPPWITFPEFEVLTALPESDIDMFFTEIYTADGFDRFKLVMKRLSSEPSLSAWHALLGEVGESIEAGRHLVTVPALLTVLEGYAVREILHITGPASKKTNLAKLFEATDFHHRKGVEAVPWISNLVFMQHLFATSDFTSDQPTLLNRHWVLHGRTQRNSILADALRLVTAIDTLSWAAKHRLKQNR
jgi:hypothetical protein